MPPSDTQPVQAEVIPLNGKPLLAPRARLVRVNGDPELVKAIAQAAAADDHQCIAPTHVMVKGDQIIGYLSLGGMPVVQAWFDTKNPHVLDSLKMIEHGETALAEAGAQTYMVAVSEQSPFRPHLERLGFQPVMETTLWIKRVG
jgi:hypothetical protein